MICRLLLATGLITVLLGGGLADGGSASDSSPKTAARRALDPKLFSELATGVVLIRTFDCSGSPKTGGSGFLVGTSVVMTARHVAFQSKKYACKIKVRIGRAWIPVATKEAWVSRAPGSTGEIEDLATLKLSKPAVDGHLFTISTSPPKAGANLAMIGHPLGNEISITQGRLLYRRTVKGVPVLAVNLLGAEGASGSAIVDRRGKVVGILQRGDGAKDGLGEITAGLVFGVDLSRSWGARAARDLCREYPEGGVPGCLGQSLPLSVTSISLKPTAAASATACVIETSATTPCLAVPASETQVTIGLTFDAASVGTHTLSSSVVGPGGPGAALCSQPIASGRTSISCTFTIPRPLRPGDYSWLWTVTNASSGAINPSGVVSFTVLPA